MCMHVCVRWYACLQGAFACGCWWVHVCSSLLARVDIRRQIARTRTHASSTSSRCGRRARTPAQEPRRFCGSPWPRYTFLLVRMHAAVFYSSDLRSSRDDHTLTHVRAYIRAHARILTLRGADSFRSLAHSPSRSRTSAHTHSLAYTYLQPRRHIRTRTPSPLQRERAPRGTLSSHRHNTFPFAGHAAPAHQQQPQGVYSTPHGANTAAMQGIWTCMRFHHVCV